MAISDILYDTLQEIDRSLQAEPGPVDDHLIETLTHMRYSQLMRDLSPDTSPAQCLAHLDTLDLDPEDTYLPGAIELLRRDVVG